MLEELEAEGVDSSFFVVCKPRAIAWWTKKSPGPIVKNEAGNENRNKIVKNKGSLYLGETI